MSESKKDQSQAGDGSPPPIGEIATMIERTPPAPAPIVRDEAEAAPIGEIESMIERSAVPD